MAIEPYRAASLLEPSTDEERLRLAIAPYVLSGEEVLWVGRPGDGAYLAKTERRLLVAMVPAVILLIGMSLPRRDFALAFVDVALLVAVAAYVLRRSLVTLPRLRAHTAYAVTSRRVLTVVEEGEARIASLDLARADEVRLEMHRGGLGTISFGTPRPEPHGPSGAPLVLERVANARGLFNLIRAAQDAEADARKKR